MSPLRGGDDDGAISGERMRGGDDAADAFDDTLGRLVERLCWAYCSGSAGLGGMSLRDVDEPSESEERIAPAAMSSMLGRRRRFGSGCCSVLEREAVEEIELLAEPVERLPPFRDLRMDFRTLFLCEPDE